MEVGGVWDVGSVGALAVGEVVGHGVVGEEVGGTDVIEVVVELGAESGRVGVVVILAVAGLVSAAVVKGR